MIGHSFGGLLVKQAFVMAQREPQYQAIYKQIIGLVFLGTPHHGADITLFARILPLVTQWHGSRRELIEFMRPGSIPNSTLHNEFISAASPQGILCVAEGLPESFHFLWWSLPLTEVGCALETGCHGSARKLTCV